MPQKRTAASANRKGDRMNWLENLRRSFLDWQAMADVLPSMITIGLKNTLILAAASTVLGVILGMVLAVMSISPSRWVRIPARIYTDIFRGAFRAVALSAWYPCTQPDCRRLYW
jgi:ABC-type amino acid transport system permease subunit